MKQVKPIWKIIAIIFIISFVLETLFIIWAYNIGDASIKQDEKCSGICLNGNYDQYALNSNICYCYLNGEVAHQEYLGS